MLDNKKREKLLENRLMRLERLIKNEACSSRKCESFESDLDEIGARAAANRLAKQFANMIGSSVRPDDLGDDVILSPMYGWLSVDRADEAADDPDARFVFNYALDDGFSLNVFPSDGKVNLISEDGYSVSPDGEIIDYDEADLYASPLSDWRGFDLSMVQDPNEDSYVDYDYSEDYDESLSRRVARIEKAITNNKRTVERKRKRCGSRNC